MKTDKIRRIKDNVILLLWVVILAAFFSFLFYRQAIIYNQQYPSDLPSQIDAAVTGGKGALLLIIRALMEATNGFKYAVALFLGFVTAFTWAAASLFIEKHLSMKRWGAMLCALALMFLTSVPVPMFRRYYAGSLVAQPWHNPPYIAMRLFAVLAMYFFAELYRICLDEKRISWMHWVLTCGMAFLATLMKTGFLMVFSVTLAIFLLKDLITKQLSLINAVLLVLPIIPSVVLMIVQYRTLCAEEPGYHIIAGLSIYFFQERLRSFIMKYITGLFFPLIVLYYNRKKLPRSMIFVYAAFGVGIIEAMFLMESGTRMNNGGFLWGMQVFAFMVYMHLVPLFIVNVKDYIKKASLLKADLYHKLYFLAGSALILLHTAYGMNYYYLLMRGIDYYI
ncbi:MAG: hypothetical protein IJ123_06820 [Blautia sp.]|nr:hypothetical protein [Blautia sp.]